jgi:predicted ATPase
MSEERLKTGYAIVREEFTEIPSISPLAAALNTNTLLDDIENVSTEFNKYGTRRRLRIQQTADFVKVEPPDIGVGISQVVPVVVIALDTRDGIIAIEQPELHLHPAMQAELGDLFIESAIGHLYHESVPKTKNQFLIETHSEHVILRILKRIRETSANKISSTAPTTPEDVSLLFISKDAQGTAVTPLRIDKHGHIIDHVPGGFFEEGFRELF